MFETVSIPEEPANKLIQTLGDLLDEASALVWCATHDPDSFDRTVAHQKCLELKARARAAIAVAFAAAKQKTENAELSAVTVPLLPTGPMTPELIAEARRICEASGLRLAEPMGGDVADDLVLGWACAKCDLINYITLDNICEGCDTPRASPNRTGES